MSKKMYNEFTLPHEILEDPIFNNLPLSSRLLYMYLGKLQNRYGNQNGWFWRSLPMLIQDTKMARRTIIKAKQSLLKHGFIDVRRGQYDHPKNRAPDYYRLNGFRRMT